MNNPSNPDMAIDRSVTANPTYATINTPDNPPSGAVRVPVELFELWRRRYEALRATTLNIERYLAGSGQLRPEPASGPEQ